MICRTLPCAILVTLALVAENSEAYDEKQLMFICYSCNPCEEPFVPSPETVQLCKRGCANVTEHVGGKSRTSRMCTEFLRLSACPVSVQRYNQVCSADFCNGPPCTGVSEGLEEMNIKTVPQERGRQDWTRKWEKMLEKERLEKRRERELELLRVQNGLKYRERRNFESTCGFFIFYVPILILLCAIIYYSIILAKRENYINVV